MVYGEIHIGECDKIKIIKKYIKNKDVKKIFLIGDKLNLDELHIPYERISVNDSIMYKYYYHFLQEINMNSLIILNESLTKNNRRDLAYNCIRKYCIQTKWRLIFNYYPIKNKEEDFATLYDFITPNPFLEENYKYLTTTEEVYLYPFTFEVNKTDYKFENEKEILKKYEQEKEKIIKQVYKDADIIPRRLLKWSDKQKPMKGYDKMNRLKPKMKVLVSNLKVDQYYYNEIKKYKEALENSKQRIKECTKRGKLIKEKENIQS